MQVDIAGSYADADEGAAQVVSAQVIANNPGDVRKRCACIYEMPLLAVRWENELGIRALGATGFQQSCCLRAQRQPDRIGVLRIGYVPPSLVQVDVMPLERCRFVASAPPVSSRNMTRSQLAVSRPASARMSVSICHTADTRPVGMSRMRGFSCTK